jgi:hypothetical protein
MSQLCKEYCPGNESWCLPCPPMSDVIGALREVLREAREDADKTFAHVAGFTDKGEAVFRRLENGTASPRISEIGEYVDAYGQAIKRSPLDLWEEAISRARTTEQELRKLAEIEGDVKEFVAKERATQERLSQGGRRKPKPAPRKPTRKSRR